MKDNHDDLTLAKLALAGDEPASFSTPRTQLPQCALTDRSEKDNSSHVHSDCGSIEPDAESKAWAALEYAFSEIDPIQLIYLRLVFLEDVSKKEVAKAFGCHPSNVGRKLNKGVKTVRMKTEAFQKRYPDAGRVEWSDLLAICKSPPDFFYEN